ncbi:4-hydroxy-tetrahydrodipicolinate reductase [bacterium]|nr:4-hydroxy-tetrahydrodipicolinate reductase [bacterium]MBU1983116.1 4-hydroxy-tetrahydrodipicolinate reductase [bacterium]
MSKPAIAALFGAAGRMGREILKQAWRHDELLIAYGYDVQNVGDVVETITVEKPPAKLPGDVKIVMDFSAAEAVLQNLERALEAGVPYLCGVTGLPEATGNELRASANEIPVFHSPNMSPGMNVMFRLAAYAAKRLPGYERHIFELHHTQKKDSPSGTALHLSRAVEEETGEETTITALRMGDVPGEHRFLLGGPGERLEIIHRADSRAVFAIGALRAAVWLVKRPPGFYKMGDVLEG